MKFFAHGAAAFWTYLTCPRSSLFRLSSMKKLFMDVDFNFLSYFAHTLLSKQFVHFLLLVSTVVHRHSQGSL